MTMLDKKQYRMNARLAVVGLIALAVLAGCSFGGGDRTVTGIESFTETTGEQPWHEAGAKTIDGTVVEVIDGDTIDVRLANGTIERVRLLGIDTPETHVEVQPDEYEGVPDTEDGRTCLRDAGEAASETVENRLASERVTLFLDPEGDTRGGYGRLLAIVVHDNRSINYQLVRGGYARLYDTEFTMRDEYAAAERIARDDNRGLWTCRSDQPA
ncbi:Endonuclease YncB, thermonuclease family [Halapricum desulfuricans]|uniref:Endonuclease YncB, thermonuclease family n=2 Tax=Halapricum desulfuricans TaxID=2841257 RepID=A0A897NSG6_9EURY|nr:Endonuclease YncB, thermonuclease family [Halapricum desulfuricans]